MALSRTAIYMILLTSYLAGGVLGLVASIVYGFHREHLAAALILACSVGMLTPLGVGPPNRSSNRPSIFRLKTTRLGFLGFLVGLIYCVVVFVRGAPYYLQADYFIGIGLCATSILSQILFSEKSSLKRDSSLIVLQILLLSLTLSICTILLFPGVYGNDAVYHTELIEKITVTGSYGGYGGTYENYPSYHVLFSLTSVVADQGIASSQVTMAALQSASLVFVFALSRKIADDRVALAATLVVAMSPHLVNSRFSMFPSYFAVAYFAIIAWTVLATPQSCATRRIILLLVAFLGSGFLHPLAPAVILVFVVGLFIGLKLMHKIMDFPHTALASMGSILVLLWMRPVGGNEGLLSNLMLSLEDAVRGFDFAGVERTTQSPGLPLSEVFMYEAGSTILIFLGVSGSLWMIRRHSLDARNSTGKCSTLPAVAFLGLIVVPIPFLLALVYPASLPDRWFPFTEVIMGIMAAVIVVRLYRLTNRTFAHMALTLAVAGFLILMITSPTANPNSQLYATSLSTRSALTESEIASIGYIRSMADVNEIEVFANSKFIYYLDQNADRHQFINPENPDTYTLGAVAIREYDLEYGFTIPLFGAEGQLLEVIKPDERFLETIDGNDKCYDNGEVELFMNLGPLDSG